MLGGVGSLLAAGAAVAGWEPGPLVVGAQAAPGPGIALGAVGTATGLISRRPSVSAMGLGALLMWMWLCRPARAGRGAARPEGPALRVLSANVLKWNRSFGELAAAIDRHAADVVITVETSAAWRSQLDRRFRADAVVAAPGGRDDGAEIVIWSTIEPDAVGTADVGGARFPWARFPTPMGDVTVVGVHVQSPVRRWKLARWKAELAGLRSWVSEQPGALVLAGDFNAGLENPSMRALCASMVDAARACGVTWAATYPATSYPLGSVPVPLRLMSLDHVLVGGQATVAGYGSGRLPGSDHDLVWADVTSAAER